MYHSIQKLNMQIKKSISFEEKAIKILENRKKNFKKAKQSDSKKNKKSDEIFQEKILCSILP